MSANQTFYKDKPYVFVPLVDTVMRSPGMDVPRVLQGECGTLQITVYAETPIHIGSGTLRYEQGNFTHTLLREKGRIVLPGSGFKGMLRSVAEAVSESCILISPANVREARPPHNRDACTGETGWCPACSLFGALGRKGKLIISSFYADHDQCTETRTIPALEAPFKDYPRPQGTQPKGKGNERLYYGEFAAIHGTAIGNMTKSDFFHQKSLEPNTLRRFYGRKFYRHSKKYDQLTGTDQYECLPVGAKLSGTITYQGLTKDELGLLLTALGVGWEKPIHHKLGYAKPAYLGSVCLCVTAQAFHNRDGLSTLTDKELNDRARYYRDTASPQVKAAIDALEQVWGHYDSELYWRTEGGRQSY